MSHTPGPWKALICPTGLSVCIVSADGMIITELPRVPPTGFDNGGNSSTLYANARLIAAAPKLLYCLKRILTDLPSNKDWLDPDIEALARASIKEAEGDE